MVFIVDEDVLVDSGVFKNWGPAVGESMSLGRTLEGYSLIPSSSGHSLFMEKAMLTDVNCRSTVPPPNYKL